MRFDFTKGKKARYMVHLYAWNVSDRYYFHYFRDAMRLFDEMKDEPHDEGTIISVSDIELDKRKAFARF